MHVFAFYSKLANKPRLFQYITRLVFPFLLQWGRVNGYQWSVLVNGEKCFVQMIPGGLPGRLSAMVGVVDPGWPWIYHADVRRPMPKLDPVRWTGMVPEPIVCDDPQLVLLVWAALNANVITL